MQSSGVRVQSTYDEIYQARRSSSEGISSQVRFGEIDDRSQVRKSDLESVGSQSDSESVGSQGQLRMQPSEVLRTSKAGPLRDLNT